MKKNVIQLEKSASFRDSGETNKSIAKAYGSLKSELDDITKQKANKRILGLFKFHLWVYNLAGEEKDSKFRRWLREDVGEAPVVLDTNLIRKTTDQMHLFLIQAGFFNHQISDSVAFKRKKATVFYRIVTASPYLIRNINYDIQDPLMASFIKKASTESMLKRGQVFSVDQMDKERKRIERYLQNLGYYGFSKEYLRFGADSSVGNRQVDLTLRVTPPSAVTTDSSAANTHQRYHINKIFVYPDFSNSIATNLTNDTLNLEGYQFVYKNQLRYKPKLLVQNIFLHEGEYYLLRNAERTYRRLSRLGIFRSVDLQFDPVPSSTDQNLLNAHIYLRASKLQNVTLEARGTNRSGSPGISGHLSYRHNNIFKSAETFELKLTGGIEAQRLLTEQADQGSESSGNFLRDLALNTVEFGPEISFYFPKFLIPFSPDRFSKSSNPSTVLSASLNFQQRPDYTRSASQLSMGYEWKETPEKTHSFYPIEVSLIQIQKSDAFQSALEEINDQLLLNSYQDHLIPATRYTFVLNDQRFGKKKNSLFYRGEIKLAGNLLRAAHQLLQIPADDNGSYRIFNIRFAQFLKLSSDLRYYRRYDEKNTIAYRLAGGVGIPRKNLSVLPFAESFFAGGSNGIRAWKARTLGPGSYLDTSPAISFDKIGEIQLEANIEYRFNLINPVEAAVFIDAGNIWLREEDSLRVGSDFEGLSSLEDIAIGTGIGLRFNLDFFILRLDAALQTRDPALPSGEKWIFQPKDTYNEVIQAAAAENGVVVRPYQPQVNINFGIGYPF